MAIFNKANLYKEMPKANYHAKPCPCPSPACDVWLVGWGAWRVAGGLNQKQAKAVAELLNGMAP